MTIYVLLASGKYTDTVNNAVITLNQVELIKAFHDYNEALALLNTGKVEVKEPNKWGVRSFYIESVELV